MEKKYNKNNKKTKFQKQKLQRHPVSHLKPNSVLASLIKSDNVIISKESLHALGLPETIQLIDELAQFVIVAPEKNVISNKTFSK
jgi:hypothetical protein